jgi:hypothetical protein
MDSQIVWSEVIASVMPVAVMVLTVFIVLRFLNPTKKTNKISENKDESKPPEEN